jgi:hypothetical protein
MSVRINANHRDVVLSLNSYEGVEQLNFQNPESRLYLVRLIAKRFPHNLAETSKGWE